MLPPPVGQAALIDPRQEEPLDLLLLDLETGEIQPVAPSGSAGCARATYTIELLRLNARDWLRTQRRHAFASFYNDLQEYKEAKRDGDAAAMQEIEQRIKERAHQTVWAEMKRQYSYYRADLALDKRGQDLIALLDALPEALSW